MMNRVRPQRPIAPICRSVGIGDERNGMGLVDRIDSTLGAGADEGCPARIDDERQIVKLVVMHQALGTPLGVKAPQRALSELRVGHCGRPRRVTTAGGVSMGSCIGVFARRAVGSSFAIA